MRLLVLVSILLLSGVNAVAQTEQQSTNSAIASSVDPTSKKQVARSPIATRLSKVCGLWAEYWRQKQLDSVVALYAPDAVFLTGTGDRISGRSAIRALFKTAM